MSSASPAESAGELPAISPAVRRRLQQCYEHAKKLMAQPKYDHDYAHTLLAECVASDPGNLVYVEAFFDNLARKYNNNKRGARLAFFLNRGAFKKALAGKKWLDVLRAGPEILKVNPWDTATLRGMAEACENLQLNEVELRYLKNALDGNPQDVEVNRHCARSLARMGQYDQAIACWARVNETKRNDPEALKMIGDLQIEKTKWKFGMLSPDKKRAAGPNPVALTPSDEGSAVPSEPEPTPTEPPRTREVQLTRWQQLERAIVDDPTVVENYLQLASVYAEENRLADAERTLQKGRAASGNDLRVQERLEEIQVLRLKQQLAIAERRAKSEATESARQLVQQLRENLSRVELEMFGRRSQRYPEEPQWKLEAAIRLKRLGNHGEALKQLGEIKPSDDSPLAASVALETGECWQHLRQFAKSLEAYRRAIHLAEANQNAELQKLALYRAGVLAIAMKDAAGTDFLAQLVEIDPNYRDARERLARRGGDSVVKGSP
jgi:tetratricopeptide (TPR) repeat protein